MAGEPIFVPARLLRRMGPLSEPLRNPSTMTGEEIERFVRLFEETSLPRPEWTHGKHLILALVYLVRHSRDEATDRIRRGIQRLNHSYGNFEGYHETITMAWIAVVSRFLDQRPRGESLSILSRGLLDECEVKDYLLRFYSKEILMSDEARRGWVPPDRLPIE